MECSCIKTAISASVNMGAQCSEHCRSWQMRLAVRHGATRDECSGVQFTPDTMMG